MIDEGETIQHSRHPRELLIVLAIWIVCPSNIPIREARANWASPEAPCAKFDNLRKPRIQDIGVKIDAAQPWADGFRHALRFWNTALAVNFHEETHLNACTVRIIDGGPGILNPAVAARSQIPNWTNFQGKIAVSQVAAKEMNSAEIYATAVHELGHMLGLKHNASSHSIMYFLDVDGTEVLDGKDILELSRRYTLRPGVLARGFLQTVYARSTRRRDGFEQNFYNFLPAMTIACPNAFLFSGGNGSDMYWSSFFKYVTSAPLSARTSRTFSGDSKNWLFPNRSRKRIALPCATLAMLRAMPSAYPVHR
jgi:hypothetical protein